MLYSDMSKCDVLFQFGAGLKATQLTRPLLQQLLHLVLYPQSGSGAVENLSPWNLTTSISILLSHIQALKHLATCLSEV